MCVSVYVLSTANYWGLAIFWLQPMTVTHIGNSYCMFALFVWACEEWIAVLQDALYIKWLICIDSLLFWKRVSEGEGTVTEDTLQMCCREYST